MAHNINTYIGRQPAWHQLGNVTGKYQTTDELLTDPGFQYRVFKSQLRDGVGREVAAWGTFRMNDADFNAWKSGDNSAKDKTTFLGVVGEDYTVIPHAEGFRTIDALMGTVNGAHYETAGVLGNGETVWALANLGLSMAVGDDKTECYLMFATAYDGSMSHKYDITGTRIVCANTLRLALSQQTKARLTVRHTKNARARLDGMHDALMSLRSDVSSVQDKMLFLAGRRLTREVATSVLDRLFPPTADADGKVKDSTRRNNILSDVLKTYELNDGNAFPETRGTVYNMLNAITNYVDHQRISDANNRGLSAMFGSGNVLKSRAFELLFEAAEDSPVMVGAPTASSSPDVIIPGHDKASDELRRMFEL